MGGRGHGTGRKEGGRVEMVISSWSENVWVD